MKKNYLLLTAVIISCSSFAQSPQGEPRAIKKKIINIEKNTKFNENTKTPTDTAGLVPNASKWVPAEFAAGGGIVTYTHQTGGYSFGVNADGLNHCGQGYKNLTSAAIGVEGVLIGALAKEIGTGGGNASATINLYNMAPNSTREWDGSMFTQTALGPNGAAIGTTTLAYSAIDTSSENLILTYAPFSNPISINGDFAVSFDAQAIASAGDTVGLWSDQDGEGFELSFHFNLLERSFLTKDSFGPGSPDNNVAIFPVINDNFVGIESHEFFNGMQASAFPNPAINNATIAYNLNENKKKVSLTIFDMSGKEVYNKTFGSQTKGSYKVNFDVTKFNAGNYFYSLIGDGNRLTKKLVIVK